MSAHPSLLALGKRVQALGHLALGKDITALGSDLASEGTTLRVFDRLVAGVEAAHQLAKRHDRLVKAARDAVALLAVAERTGELDAAAGLAVLARLRAALKETR